jgi:hypothetical protein
LLAIILSTAANQFLQVVNWFNAEKAVIAQQHSDRVIPSLAFVHIPVHATLTFQHSKLDPNTSPGINEDDVGHQGITTNPNGKSYYNKLDTPFMQSLAATQGLIAVVSGHDHGDDWCMKWGDLVGNEPVTGNGINLCFGRHTGYGGYSDWTRGARQIVVHEDMLNGKVEVETWIRLENGKISGYVVLNETFGTDKYPIVEKTTSHLLPESGDVAGDDD